jgi:hypothetical protein
MLELVLNLFVLWFNICVKNINPECSMVAARKPWDAPGLKRLQKYKYELSIIEINVRINTESYCFHLVSYLYLMYQNFLACAVEVCVKFSFQWKVGEKLSTIKFLTGEEYDLIYFTCCTKILHDQCFVLLFIRLFTFLTNNTSLALIGRNPFRACFYIIFKMFII